MQKIQSGAILAISALFTISCVVETGDQAALDFGLFNRISGCSWVRNSQLAKKPVQLLGSGVQAPLFPFRESRHWRSLSIRDGFEEKSASSGLTTRRFIVDPSNDLTTDEPEVACVIPHGLGGKILLERGNEPAHLCDKLMSTRNVFREAGPVLWPRLHHISGFVVSSAHNPSLYNLLFWSQHSNYSTCSNLDEYQNTT